MVTSLLRVVVSAVVLPVLVTGSCEEGEAENTPCDFSGDDGICAKPSQTVDGKTSLTCKPWEIVECSQNLDVSQGPRPVGSKCSMRRRRQATGRVCMKYNDDGSPSENLRCVPESISKCQEKAEGDNCGSGLAAEDNGCYTKSPQAALMCTKLNEHACWSKADGDSCSFKVYGEYTETSKCISSVCEEPEKGACLNKLEGASCAGYAKITKERISLEHRRRRATTMLQYSREEMTGGSCAGAVDSKRVCEGATVSSSEILTGNINTGVPITAPGVLATLVWLCTASSAA